MEYKIKSFSKHTTMNRAEAIKIIRETYHTEEEMEALETLIPELKESRDEQIRKAIIKSLDMPFPEDNLPGTDVTYEEAVSWLEKQKEQKPAEWSEDWREEDIQTRFAFYTYKDEDGVLYLSNVFVEEASRNHGFGTRILKAAEKVAETIGATTISLKVKQDSPANAWYRKNGYGYVAFEDGYDWLEKNLEYMKPNKQEWSEEDTEMYINVASSLRGYACGLENKEHRKHIKKGLDWLENRFKSLRPQSKIHYWTEEEIEPIISDYLTGKEHYGGMIASLRCLKPKSHWKPSEEQMKALLNAEGYLRAGLQHDSAKTIAELYEQLKKLM